MKTLVITLDSGEVLRTQAMSGAVEDLLDSLDDNELIIATIHIEYDNGQLCKAVNFNLEDIESESKTGI